MKIVVIAVAQQREELTKNIAPGAEIIWKTDADDIQHDTDAVIDLLFRNEKDRIDTLRKFLPKVVITNSVINTLKETDENFTRVNGWNTFLLSSLIEASGGEEQKSAAEKVLNVFGKKIEWVPDIAGFITPRVISMIINEAYFALSEGVSTKEEINTAMKLGTNYPFGPFEWGEKIGLDNIAALLQKLSEEQLRYQTSPLLLSEAGI